MPYGDQQDRKLPPNSTRFDALEESKTNSVGKKIEMEKQNKKRGSSNSSRIISLTL